MVDYSDFDPRILRQTLSKISQKYPTFQFDFQNNVPTIRVGSETYNTPAEALEYIKKINLTQYDVFDSTIPSYLKSGQGANNFLMLEELSETLGVRIERLGMKSASVKQIEAINEVFSTGMDREGLFYAKNDNVTGLIFHQNGKKLKLNEILDLLENKGIHFDVSQKTFKRLRFLGNDYKFSASGLDLNAYFFEAAKTQRGMDLMNKAGYTFSDGGYKVASSRRIGDMSNLVGNVSAEYSGLPSEMSIKTQKNVLKAYKELNLGGALNTIQDISSLSDSDVTRYMLQLSSDEILESGKYIDSLNMVRRAFDGAVYARSSLAGKVAEQAMQRAAKMTQDMSDDIKSGRLIEGSVEHKSALRKIAATKRSAAELDPIVKHGGVFNVRIMGFNDVSAEDEFVNAIFGENVSKKGFSGQVKGNVYFEPDKQFEEALMSQMKGYNQDLVEYRGKLYSMDEMIATHKNLGLGTVITDAGMSGRNRKLVLDEIERKGGTVLSPRSIDVVTSKEARTVEVGFRQGSAMANRGAALSMEVQASGTKVFSEAQSFFADFELYDMDAIRRTNMQYVQKQIDYVKTDKILDDYARFRTTGESSGILRQLVDQADGIPGEASTVRAQQLLDMLDQGIAPSKNPLFAQMYTSAVNEFNPRKDMFHLLMPNVYQAQFTNELGRSSQVTRGSISYKKNLGFILNDLDYDKYYNAFGGPDFDDLLRSHLKWDRGSDSLIAIMKRTPSALGEIGVFSVDQNDQLMDEVLKNAAEVDDAIKGHIDSVKLLDAKINIKSSLQASANSATGVTGANAMQNLKSLSAVSDIVASPEVDAQRLASIMDEIDTLGSPTDDSLRYINDAIDSLGIGGQTVEDLEAEKALLRGGTRKDILRDYFERTHSAMESSEINKIRNRSLALSDEALQGIAKYGSVDELLANRMSRMSNQLITGIGDDFGSLTDESIEALTKSFGVLGEYSNLRMVLDSMKRVSDELGNAPNFGDDAIKILRQEDVIDALTKEGGALAEEIRGINDNIVSFISDYLLQGGKIDKFVIDNEFGEKTRLSKEHVNRINQKLIQSGRTLDEFTVEGPLTQRAQAASRIMEDIGDQYRMMRRDIGLVDGLKNQLFDLDIEREADELMTIARETYKVDDISFRSASALNDAMDLFGEIPDFNEVSDRVGRAQTEFFRTFTERYGTRLDDETLEISERGQKVLGSMIKRHSLTPLGEGSGSLFGGNLSGVFNSTLQWYDNLGRGNVAGVSGQLTVDNKLGAMLEEIDSYDRPQAVSEAIDAATGDIGSGQRSLIRSRAARRASEGVSDFASNTKTKLPKILSQEGLNLFKNQTFKRGAIALGGLMTFSAIYRKMKDRTPEDMQGPPMLPGGSFYDNNAGMYSQQIINSPQNNQGGGTTYKIRASGSFDVDALSGDMENLTGAQVRSNKYESRGYQNKSSNIERVINDSFR